MAFIAKNRKKNLIVSFLALLLFSGVIFSFSDVQSADAVEQSFLYGDCGDFFCPKSVSESISTAAGKVGGAVTDGLKPAFQWLLYGIFVTLGLLTSLAITIFEWAIDPKDVAVLFGNPGIYESWKFIRDFFNLFFILVLLYTAFTLVFQVSKDFKKALLSIVLAALFINFSYPVSRALIDMTNVPMYFFANQMMASNPGAGSGTGLFGSALTATSLETTLLPNKQDSNISRLLIAIVFLFIFSITLLVLSIMFVIRLVALVVLVIFSPVGFAVSIIPGLEKYSGMWWDNFWKYAFFGPAAMLMLLVSVRLFSSLGNGSEVFANMKTVAGNVVGVDQSFFASMALFSIPIIMLWFTMGLAKSFSIVGAGMVVDKGQAFTKWAGKKTYNNTLTRGVGKGIKERAENNGVLKYVTPKYWKDSSQQTEERIAGRVGGGREGYNRVIENQHNKQVAENEKKMEEGRMSATVLKEHIDPRTRDKYSAAEREAAANILAKKEQFSSASELNNAVEAIKSANKDPQAQAEKVKELIKKANGNALDSMDVTQYNNMAALGPDIKKELDKKLKKEGKSSVLIEVEVANTMRANPAGNAGVVRQAAVNNMLSNMSSSDVAKQDVFRAGNANEVHAQNYMTLTRISNPERYQKIQADLP
ncbi:MAG: hypothetical protein PHH40_03580 [Candidatus Moranbacteria bacterium]|nr:hypothetical protein [Candidatus Moranbacteria bacterium]MDD3964671.1 hypothetical protein [Candidatus Moranbacteria bacterium]